jgi:hypothetical protein
VQRVGAITVLFLRYGARPMPLVKVIAPLTGTGNPLPTTIGDRRSKRQQLSYRVKVTTVELSIHL